MFKYYHWLFIFLCLIGGQAYSSAKQLQLCLTKCQTELCKKMAEHIEFELEVSKEYLLPACKYPLAMLKKNESRLVIFEKPKAGLLWVELACEGNHNCLSKGYRSGQNRAALVSQIVADIKLAIKKPVKLNSPDKPLVKERLKTVVEKSQKKILATPAEDEWDRVILATPTPHKEASAEVLGENVLPPPSVRTQTLEMPTLGSVTTSFGAESWNYIFTAKEHPERVSPVNSRIYPRISLSGTYWPFSILRLSANVSGSILNFRLRANQPVEGDGQLVRTQIYDADFRIALLRPFAGIVHFGLDSGYEFRAAFVDEQRLADRAVTVVPSYQSHALRIGPRIVIGALSDKGVIDVGVGFYPYVYYAESPDEPASAKRLFAWNIQGLVRLMLGSDMFLDAQVRAHTFHVDYSMDAKRESVDGEKWGAGSVTSTSASTALGIGWLF